MTPADEVEKDGTVSDLEPGKDRYEEGLAVRREVLGDEHVERSIKAADEFSLPIQDFVIEYCWGEIWSRPGLDRRTRSILNLGMLTALNRSHELAVHVRGALNNGVTREEIREALMQTAVYVGVPAAMESFRVAKQVFDELAASARGERAEVNSEIDT